MGKILSLIGAGSVILVAIFVLTRKKPILFSPSGFPVNPQTGSTYVSNGVSYTYTASGIWIITPNVSNVSSNGTVQTGNGVTTNVVVPTNVPSYPKNGQVWIDTSTGLSWTFTTNGGWQLTTGG